MAKKSQYEKEQDALLDEQLRQQSESVEAMLAADPARDEKERLMNEATAFACQAALYHTLRRSKFDGWYTVHTGWNGTERFLSVDMKFFDRSRGQMICKEEYYLREREPLEKLKEEYLLMRAGTEVWVLDGRDLSSLYLK